MFNCKLLLKPQVCLSTGNRIQDEQVELVPYFSRILTFPLKEESEEGAGSGDSLVVVVVIVDGQQVAVDVGVTHKQVHVGNTMDVLQEAVELIKAAWL